VSGPTQSGKTCFTINLIENAATVIKPPPTRIIWCYGEPQPELVRRLPSCVKFCESLAEGTDMVDSSEINLLILDDLMLDAGSSKDVQELFTKGSHHRNLSVIFIVQNLFHQGKAMRTISLNAHYMILFKNPRDAGQIKYLASQLFPGRTNFLVDAYKQATCRPHGYLLLDLKQETLENHRVLSDVLPTDKCFGGYRYEARQ
jgi:hypothetical protein